MSPYMRHWILEGSVAVYETLDTGGRAGQGQEGLLPGSYLRSYRLMIYNVSLMNQLSIEYALHSSCMYNIHKGQLP